MAEDKTKMDVWRKPTGTLGWSIAATIMGCLPLGILAIIKATESRRLWKEGKYDEADAKAPKADIFSLAAFVFPFVLFTLYSIIFGNEIVISILVAFLLAISGAVGMYLGKQRTCGYAGGFFFGSTLSILGWIIIGALPCK